MLLHRRSLRPGVHPRIRGEDMLRHLNGRGFIGSPPHTRGRYAPPSQRPRLHRFTPAYAGKIYNSLPPLTAYVVHPRIRGEDSEMVSDMRGVLGSPPHTRGRSRDRSHNSVNLGFTPAYAGKICRRHVRRWWSGVHPRIRGEDYVKRLMVYFRTGSPPHTRGRSSPERPRGSVGRFTPAYAGKIDPLRQKAPAAQVHPRIRGEDRSW